jgi:hypothetical protein
MTTEQVCTDCGALFDTAEELDSHRGESGHRQAFKCDECGAEFASQGDLEEHLTEVHSAEPDAPIR